MGPRQKATTHCRQGAEPQCIKQPFLRVKEIIFRERVAKGEVGCLGEPTVVQKAKAVTEAASSLLTGLALLLPSGDGAFSVLRVFTVLLYQSVGSEAGGESLSAGRASWTLSPTVT